METGGWDMTQRILDLTLEILHLLTGEDYSPVKKTSRGETSCVRSRTMANEQKILNLSWKIIELLNGEVPVRCQDVTVHFSLEEWDYIEEHKDQYQDLMLQDPRTRTSPDGDNEEAPAERCLSPMCSQDFPQEIPGVQASHPGTEGSTCCKDEDLVKIKDEVRKLEEELKTEHVSPEEETPTYINNDGKYSSSDTWDKGRDPHCKPEESLVPEPQDEPLHHLHLLAALTSDSSSLEEPSALTEVLKPGAVRRNDKTFQCSDCCKTFAQNADLIRHLRTHTGERPFSCTECGKCFTQKSALVYHRRIHTGERPFLCYDCGKCFAHKSILVNHRRVHTGEKPFSCPDCGKCFAYKSYLIDHQRIHAGVKPHLCKECRKSFTHKSDLNRHRRVHSREKTKCGELFTQ
ncbi:gastrula zinc finger protein XlCGF66.1-like [Engystomops pustulosus]|uniref:gastrula zinc finger protein XlCGF66.1-like n=1 Tax=Engystomops pustulosus TaxID=76066 RepID=UPI003AFB3998